MTTLRDTRIKQERLLQVIAAELRDLPPLPAVISRIMQTMNEPTTSAEDLSELISSDQMLSSQVLRLVNSTYYGFPKRITTISYAIVILGLNTVRNLVTTVGVKGAFKTIGKTALAREQFWAHSIATAVCARIIAHRRGFPQKQCEEVFTGGLLHDIGKLFLDQYFADQYSVTLKLARTQNISLVNAENTALGVRHVLVGKLVAEKWNFPSSLTAMISLHHHPAMAKQFLPEVSVVHAGEWVARKLGLGDPGDSIVPPMDPAVHKWLGYTAAQWQAIERETLEKFTQAKDMVMG